MVRLVLVWTVVAKALNHQRLFEDVVLNVEWPRTADPLVAFVGSGGVPYVRFQVTRYVATSVARNAVVKFGNNWGHIWFSGNMLNPTVVFVPLGHVTAIVIF